MNKILLLISFCFCAVFTQAQNYELQSKLKINELFTIEMMDSIEAKVAELQHPTNTVYFEWSAYTTLVIFPKSVATKKETEL